MLKNVLALYMFSSSFSNRQLGDYKNHEDMLRKWSVVAQIIISFESLGVPGSVVPSSAYWWRWSLYLVLLLLSRFSAAVKHV